MRAAKKLNNKISPRGKMKVMPRKVLADKTNQEGRKRLKKMPLDEKTMTRRSRRVPANENNQQDMGKESLVNSNEIDKKISISKEENVKKEAIEENLKEEMMEVNEEINEETKEEVKEEEEKKWDPLDGLSEYEKIRLENIRQVSTYCTCHAYWVSFDFTHFRTWSAFWSPANNCFLKTQREALFAELQLSEAKAAATPPRASALPGSQRRSAPSRRGLQTPKREKEEENLPRRQSSRLKEGVYEIQRYADSKCSIEIRSKQC